MTHNWLRFSWSTHSHVIHIFLLFVLLQFQLPMTTGHYHHRMHHRTRLFSRDTSINPRSGSSMLTHFLHTIGQLSGKSSVKGGRDCADSILNWSYNRSPDAHLRTPEIILKYGYRVETHYAISKDGYIITLFRIPSGKKGANGKSAHKVPRGAKGKKKPVVFLQHGVICTSSDWLMNTEEKSLPYILANTGYDVWLGNARGTTYSDRHEFLNKHDLDYWKFSWHEMGVYDIPATIDYILAHTKEPKLYYIGHSMGTTLFWVAMSMRPEYNAKIRSMYALAPVAYLEHMICPVSLLAPLAKYAAVLSDNVHNGRFLPKTLNKILHGVGPIACAVSPVALVGCGAIFFAFSGFDPCQVNTTQQLSNIVGHTPDDTSARTIIHFLQVKSAKSFRRYDYGPEEHWGRYGPHKPPPYNLSKVTAKVAVFWGQNDHVSAPVDVDRLVDQLPNVIEYHRVDFDLWSHLDFTYGVDAKILVYDHVLRMMAKNY